MRDKRSRKMRERKRAERFEKTLFNFAFANFSEGRRVTVRGRFSTSSWKDSSGNKKYFTQVVAEQVAVVLSGAPYANGTQGGQPQNNGKWGGPAQASAPQQQGEQVPPPKDEDLPF